MESNGGGGGSPKEAAVVVPSSGDATLGGHLARRLVQVGVSDVFAVPGDFNLTLLDHLLPRPGALLPLPEALQPGQPPRRARRHPRLPRQGRQARPRRGAQAPRRQGRRGLRGPRRRQRLRGGRHAVRQGAGAGDAAALHRDLLGRGQHGLLRGDRGVRGRLPVRGAHLQRLQLRGVLVPAEEGEGGGGAARPRDRRQWPRVRVRDDEGLPVGAGQARPEEHDGVRQLQEDLRAGGAAAGVRGRGGAAGERAVQAHTEDDRWRGDRGGDGGDGGLVVQLPEAAAARGLRVRVPDAVRLHRVVGGGAAGLRAGCPKTGGGLHRRRQLPGDGAGRVDDAALRAAEHHLPHQQRRVHHRGGDPRRAVQRDQELGLRGPRQRHPQRRGAVLGHPGAVRGGAGGGHRDGHGGQGGQPLLHRGGGAQGRHQQGAPRMGLQSLRRQLQAAQPAVVPPLPFILDPGPICTYLLPFIYKFR
ncbi:hypothetical protein EE612_041547 [Oryza sativa]|nr:hypothetical protein EE612_041547 [Oryza sativa]